MLFFFYCACTFKEVLIIKAFDVIIFCADFTYIFVVNVSMENSKVVSLQQYLIYSLLSSFLELLQLVFE